MNNFTMKEASKRKILNLVEKQLQIEKRDVLLKVRNGNEESKDLLDDFYFMEEQLEKLRLYCEDESFEYLFYFTKIKGGLQEVKGKIINALDCGLLFEGSED